MSTTKIISFILIVISFILAAIIYPLMPSKLVSHWDSQGLPNGFMPRFWGIFLMPLMALSIYLIFLLLPVIDPLKKNYKHFKTHYDLFILVIIGFLFYIYLLTIFWNLDMKFSMNQLMIPAIAIIFFYSGVLIEKAKMNWFVGIRTPWTLSSDKVWGKTHKLGGKLFKYSAAISLIGIFFNNFGIYFVIIPAILISVYLFIYSYLQYKIDK